MAQSSSNRVRRRQIGIVPRLLMASLGAVVVAVISVQAWTLHVVNDQEMKTAQHALDTNLAVLKQTLGVAGGVWQADNAGGLILNGHPLGNAMSTVDAVHAIAGGAATIFAGDVRVATTLLRADGTRLVGERLAAGPVRDAVLGRGETYRGEARILGAPYLTVYAPILDAAGHPIGILFVGTSLTEAHAVVAGLLHQSLLIGLVVIVLVGAVRWVMLQSTMRPLSHLAEAVRSIAEGQLDRSTPCAERTDQLGEIGRAIETLRTGALASRTAEAKASADRAARDRRQEAMDRLTRDFATTISGVLSKLGEAADEVRHAATDMTDAANRTRADMGVAAGDADVSAQNLSSVAAATDELTANGSEISRQVAQVSRATDYAVAQAQSTAQTVVGLDEAARQISDVVDLIGRISGQTNLLALNATIEAARAGEAGKGFAVVASEVKQLAAQTDQATARIGEQIKAIQGATVQAVTAVRSVSEAIAEAGQAAATIAASVSEQGSATQEIAIQVQTVSQATGNATRAMRDASVQAGESETRSRSVLSTADHVASVTARLRAEVDEFLGATRASWDSGDRRLYERIDGGGLRARLDCSTYGKGEGEIDNISLGGASLLCQWPCDVGAELLVELPGADGFVSARVVDSRDTMLQVAFRQDKTTLGQIGRTIDLITARASGQSGRQAA